MKLIHKYFSLFLLIWLSLSFNIQSVNWGAAAEDLEKQEAEAAQKAKKAGASAAERAAAEAAASLAKNTKSELSRIKTFATKDSATIDKEVTTMNNAFKEAQTKAPKGVDPAVFTKAANSAKSWGEARKELDQLTVLHNEISSLEKGSAQQKQMAALLRKGHPTLDADLAKARQSVSDTSVQFRKDEAAIKDAEKKVAEQKAKPKPAAPAAAHPTPTATQLETAAKDVEANKAAIQSEKKAAANEIEAGKRKLSDAPQAKEAENIIDTKKQAVTNATNAQIEAKARIKNFNKWKKASSQEKAAMEQKDAQLAEDIKSNGNKAKEDLKVATTNLDKAHQDLAKDLGKLAQFKYWLKKNRTKLLIAGGIVGALAVVLGIVAALPGGSAKKGTVPGTIPGTIAGTIPATIGGTIPATLGAISGLGTLPATVSPTLPLGFEKLPPQGHGPLVPQPQGGGMPAPITTTVPATMPSTILGTVPTATVPSATVPATSTVSTVSTVPSATVSTIASATIATIPVATVITMPAATVATAPTPAPVVTPAAPVVTAVPAAIPAPVQRPRLPRRPAQPRAYPTPTPGGYGPRYQRPIYAPQGGYGYQPGQGQPVYAPQGQQQQNQQGQPQPGGYQQPMRRSLRPGGGR